MASSISRRGTVWIRWFLVFGLLPLWATLGVPRAWATPPSTPTITEPAVDGQIINAQDVHMEAGGFFDLDGDTHACTNWEIWKTATSEKVWQSAPVCIGGVEKNHTHLGDGAFMGSYAGRTTLEYSTTFTLGVRFQDNAFDVSAWAVRAFETGPASETFPLMLEDVVTSPAPLWKDAALGANVILPSAATQPFVRLENAASDELLTYAGLDGVTNTLTNPAPLPAHFPVRIRISAGSLGSNLVLPESQVSFTDSQAVSHTIYLPSLSLTPTQSLYYWVAIDGSTYVGQAAQTEPDFSTLARGASVPWQVLQPGYKVEVVATGFQLPVNIAFVPNPGPNPDDPLYYVTELYGTIKVVTQGGAVSDYATGLLNFNPTGLFPGSGEQGLTGIVVDGNTGNIYASMLYSSVPFSDTAPHYPKVVRFQSVDGGRTALTQTVILDMVGESQGQSHQVSNLSIGPDGKLYVHVGDGFSSNTAQNLNSYRGKILRLNLDGSAPADNPFYDGAPFNSRDYIYAYGFRNPFGGGWRVADGGHYDVSNGPSVDRFAKIARGANYGWDLDSNGSGTDAEMYTNAIYNWNQAAAPVNVAFIQPSTFGGSGFPVSAYDHAFVAESGATWATGPQLRGKRITEFVITNATSPTVVSGPMPLIQYTGAGKATVAALAAGPDGLYFSDLYKDLNYITPIDRGANILRVRFVGAADFTSDITAGLAPLTVNFTDTSSLPSPSAWLWDFGDGVTATVQHPSHTYLTGGTYTVTLTTTGTNGASVMRKSAYVAANTGLGLLAEYYDFSGATPPADPYTNSVKLRRIDPVVDFNTSGSFAPSVATNNFAVRWTGYVLPQFTEVYTFYTTSDDGVRLWVNNSSLSNWTNHGTTTNTLTVTLTANISATLKMEYYDSTGGAVARLSWSSPSQPLQVVPSNRLYPGTNLALSTSASSNPVNAGGWLTYTLVLTNYGLGPRTTNVVVTDSLPANVVFDSVSAPCAHAGGLVTCPVGSLIPGQSLTHTIRVSVPVTLTGLLTTTAGITSTAHESDSANNTVTLTTTVQPAADLAISKSDGLATAIPGALITYTIGVTNNGPNGVTNAVVSDVMPLALTGVTWSCSTSLGSSCGTPSGSGNLSTTLILLNTGTATVVVSGTLNSAATGTLTNTATVTLPADRADPNLTNNTATDTTALAPTAELSLAETEGSDPVLAGSALTYTLVISNAGPSQAAALTLTNTLPTGVIFESASVAPVSGPNPLVWDFATLAANSTQAVILTVTVNSNMSGTLTNIAAVASAAADTLPANNTVTATTTITTLADVSLTNVAVPDPVIAGETLTYTLVVSNAGPSDALNVSVTDTLPAGVTFQSATPTQGSGPNPLAWNLGTLTAHSTETLTVVVTVNNDITATLTNTVQVDSGTGDANLANNSAIVTTTVNTLADIRLAVSDGTDPVREGDVLTYTLVVSNVGPSLARSVAVTDTLPVGVTFQSASVAPTSGPNPLVWNLGALAVNTSQSLVVTVTVDLGTTGPLTNTASASSLTADATPANNSALETTLALSALADLSVSLSTGADPVLTGDPLTYTLVISNAGPSAAQGVTLTDTLPAGVTFQAASLAPNGGPNPLTWNLGTLAANAAQTILVTVTVDSGLPRTLTNTVSASTTTAEATLSNNTADTTTQVTAQADLSISQTDGLTNILPGGIVTYTLVVTNTGPDAVVGALVTDTFPVALTGVTWSCGNATGGASCDVTGGSGDLSVTVNLPVSGTVTIIASGTLTTSAVGLLINTAYVSASSGWVEQNTANNTAMETTVIDTPIRRLFLPIVRR